MAVGFFFIQVEVAMIVHKQIFMATTQVIESVQAVDKMSSVAILGITVAMAADNQIDLTTLVSIFIVATTKQVSTTTEFINHDY